MDLKEFASEHSLDEGALACLVLFLRDNIMRTPEKIAAFQAMTEAQRSKVIERGVSAWYEHSQQWLMELVDNESERAQAARAQIATDVWEAAQKKRG